MADYSDLAYTLSGYGRKASPYDAKRRYGYGLLQQGMDTSPIQSPWQGAARLAQALVGGWQIGKADEDEKEATAKRNDSLAAVMAEPDSSKRIAKISALDPELGMRLSGQLAVEQAKLKQQNDQLQAGAQGVMSGYGFPPTGQGAQPPQQAQGGYQGPLAGYESGNNPQAVNPQSGAGGLFQFLPGTWEETRRANPHLNLPATVGQANEDQQKAAEEALRAGNAKALQAAGIQPTPGNLYLAHRAGAEGAKTILQAAPDTPLSIIVPPIWLQQNPDMRTTAGRFVEMANQRFPGGGQPAPGVPGAIAQAPLPPLGQSPQIAQGDAQGMPPAPNPAQATGPAIVAPPAPPAVPDVPRPQPSKQLVEQHYKILQGGGYGQGPEAVSRFRAAIEADVDRQWQVDRERAKAGYDQQFESYKHQRGLQDKKDNPQFTQEQNLAHTYATRLNAAIPQLEALIRDPASIPSWTEQMRANSPYAPEFTVSAKAKEFRRIVKDIMSATLRRESGASIADSEYASEAQKFIPQPGDTPEIVQNKLTALKQAARSIAEGTGRPVGSYSFFGDGPPAGATPLPSGGVPPPPPGFRPL